MIALQGHHLQATYIADPIFKDVNFSLRVGEKVGLVGANGAGKTTLFRTLTGEMPLEKGSISLGQNLRMGYLEQHYSFDQSITLMEAIMSVYEDLFALWDEIHYLTQQMPLLQGEDLRCLLDDYAQKIEKFEDLDGYSAESKGRGIIRGLGFSKEDEERSIGSFSGGEKTRLMLARLLIREPDVLLLDEPTNHLDIDAVEWLESYLKHYTGALLVISHDRYFLDEIVDRVFDLSHHRLTTYQGNYSRYLIQKREDEAVQRRSFLKQQELIDKEKAYIERNRAGVHAKQARGRETRLKKIEPLENIPASRSIRLIPHDIAPSADIVLRAENLGKKFNQENIFSQASMELRRGQKVGLIGPNGVGKSTFLKIIAGQVRPDEGHFELGSRVQLAYYDQEHAHLNPDWTVFEQIIRTTSLKKSEAQDVLAHMLFFKNDLDKKIRLLSGGERGRLGLLLTLLKNPNFILMDEPTNHLDIPSKEVVEEYLKKYDGTLLVVSHDRYFLNAICDQTYVLSSKGMAHYLGNYAYYKEKEAELKRLKDERRSSQQQSITVKKARPDKARSRKRNQLQKKVQEIEKSIEELENKLECLGQTLKNNMLHHEEYSNLAESLQKTEEVLGEKMNHWMELSQCLEELEG